MLIEGKPAYESNRPSKRGALGVTLIELLVTVAILTILLSLGVPSFQTFIAENRVKTATTDFMSSLNLARSEAIRRGVRVVVCKSSDPNATTPACVTTGTWAQGWIVFVDTNNDASHASTEKLLQARDALDQVLASGNTNVASYVSFTSTGTTKLTSGSPQNGTLTICGDTYQRQIIINDSGRIRVIQGTC